MQLSAYLITALLCLTPISELRGGIPFAYFNNMHPVLIYFYCVALNLLVSPFVYIFMNTIHKLFLRFGWYKTFSEMVIERARNKIQKKVKKFGYIGLTIFVLIPLPITGAYTGTLGAWILGLDKIKTILSVSLGVCIAGGLIMCAMWLSSLGFDFFSVFFQEQHA